MTNIINKLFLVPYTLNVYDIYMQKKNLIKEEILKNEGYINNFIFIIVLTKK